MHETMTRTCITFKKITCYIRDSACRWFIVKKKLKYFEIMINIFEFCKFEKMQDLDRSMKISFFELPNHTHSHTRCLS